LPRVPLPMVSEEAISDLPDMMTKRITLDQALPCDNAGTLRMHKSRLFRFREDLLVRWEILTGSSAEKCEYVRAPPWSPDPSQPVIEELPL
jgi:hypothetical protein